MQRALYGEEPIHHEFQNTERAISLIIEVEESIVRKNNFHKESMPTFSFPSFSYSSFIIVFPFFSSSFRHPTPYWHRVRWDFMKMVLLIIVHVLLHERCASAHDKLLRSLVGYLLTNRFAGGT